MLEKVYAKVNTNYEKMGLGWMSEAMRILTGCPSIKFQTSELAADKMWSMMASADKQHYMMTAATAKSMFGLVPGHAYTVLGVYELTD